MIANPVLKVDTYLDNMKGARHGRKPIHKLKGRKNRLPTVSGPFHVIKVYYVSSTYVSCIMLHGLIW